MVRGIAFGALLFAGTGAAAAMIALPAHSGTLGDQITCSTTVHERSIEACNRLIESPHLSDRDRFMAYFNRGWNRHRAGADRDALVDFDAAEQLDPHYANLYLSRAIVHQELGDHAKALLDLDRYVGMVPNDWAGLYRRAVSLRHQNAYKDALAELGRAARLNPYAKEIAPLRILLLSQSGNGSNAQTEADRLVVQRRSDPVSLYVRAVLHSRANRLGLAAKDLDEAVASSPVFAAAHELRGEINEREGRVDDARSHYELAQRIGGPDLDSKIARERARNRLDALNSGRPVALEAEKAEPAVSKTAAAVRVSGADCRRFIPVTMTVVAVKCD